MQLPILEILDRNFSARSSEYETFALEKDKCRKCGIFNCYQQVIQSEGNALDPIFMIIGESPGRDEVEQIRPFIGQAGQLLRDTLRKHGPLFSRKTTLISNVLACRPENNKFPDTNKEPMICTHSWLFKEIMIARPKIVICLGNHALWAIRRQKSITKNRGTWVHIDQSPAWFRCMTFATFHPSYVIRCEKAKNLEVRQQFESDFDLLANEYAEHLSASED